MNFKQNIARLLLIAFVYMACVLPTNAQSTDKNKQSVASELFHIPYVSQSNLKNPTLVLVLHGDAPFNKPSYQYPIARKIAKANPNVVAVGVLRPGYTDRKGNRSKGRRGKTTGDNYTPKVLAAIQKLTTQLKKQYTPAKIVLVGHSGGAAISANLLATYPQLYTGAVLISCPCDLHRWRAHMKNWRGDGKNSIWDEKVRSLSPIEEVKGIDKAAKIAVVHGTKDKVVPLSIANRYVKALKTHRHKVSFVAIEGQGHEIAFNPKVFELVKELIR
jgi:predicted esterase